MLHASRASHTKQQRARSRTRTLPREIRFRTRKRNAGGAVGARRRRTRTLGRCETDGGRERNATRNKTPKERLSPAHRLQTTPAAGKNHTGIGKSHRQTTPAAGESHGHRQITPTNHTGSRRIHTGTTPKTRTHNGATPRDSSSHPRRETPEDPSERDDAERASGPRVLGWCEERNEMKPRRPKPSPNSRRPKPNPNSRRTKPEGGDARPPARSPARRARSRGSPP